jgi:hypothetical protein
VLILFNFLDLDASCKCLLTSGTKSLAVLFRYGKPYQRFSRSRIYFMQVRIQDFQKLLDSNPDPGSRILQKLSALILGYFLIDTVKKFILF